jgi:hypothetical protein
MRFTALHRASVSAVSGSSGSEQKTPTVRAAPKASSRPARPNIRREASARSAASIPRFRRRIAARSSFLVIKPSFQA